MKFNIKYVFAPDYENFEGVRRINIYLLRILYFLMAFVLGQTAWAFLITKSATVSPVENVAWSVWAAFSVVSMIGLFRPIKMLPIVLLEIVYKVIWLVFVPLPLLLSNTLAGSAAEGLANIFIWIIFPIVIVPWKYVFRNYILNAKSHR